MVQVKQADEIIDELREQGYRFSVSTARSSGRYTPVDAEWNYKDIPHLNYVHTQVGGVTFYTTDDASSSLFIQRFMGLRAIFCGMLYQSSAESMTYLFTSAFFVVIIETSWREEPVGHTTVTTQYHIGSPRLLRPVHGLLHAALQKNYRLLMTEDTPMRQRRGELRSRGYGYRADTEGVSFLTSLRIGRQNLVPPASAAARTLLEVDVPGIDDGTTLVGTDDYDGVRIVKSGQHVTIFPRMCAHDGASLDGRPISESGNIECPWHGRQCGALMSFDLDSAPDQVVSWGPNTIRVDPAQLTITSRVDDPMAASVAEDPDV